MQTTSQAQAAPGKLGAKVMSFDENAARAFVKRIMDRYPEASREEIVRRVRALVTGRDHKYLASFVDYATINAWRVIREGERRPADNSDYSAANLAPDKAPPMKTAAELDAARQAALQQRGEAREQAKADVKMILLDLVAPNGKLWRDLSIAEYMNFGKRQFHHGQAMLKAGHKKSELLATATDEADLQKIFAK